ncbi:MAG: vWA domain-containing protein [Candidatus Heimdallarchaeaceae archaeon]|jgi:predicted metal-dependent peptidase
MLEQKLTKAKIGIVIKQVFLSHFLMKMPLVEAEWLGKKPGTFPTMATDGKFIYWHPEFVKKCSDSELQWCLCHEALHPAFLHHLRIGDRKDLAWNAACDYAINIILKEAGLNQPPDTLYDNKFKDMTAEEIYDKFPKIPQTNWNVGAVMKYNPNAGKGEEGDGDGKDKESGDSKWGEYKEPTPEEMKLEEQKWITEFVQAASIAKGIGKLPAGIERILDEFVKPKIDWKAILQRFLTETIRNDYNWSRPNRRYISNGLYLPHLQSPAIGDGIVMVDTSGSVNEKQLNQLASEIKGITDAFKVNLNVIYVDYVVCGHDELNALDSDCELHPKGNGGTSFAPGFDWAVENDVRPAFGIYLTDGGSNEFPDYAPDYPFIWVLTENYYGNFDPPFGEVMEMPND